MRRDGPLRKLRNLIDTLARWTIGILGRRVPPRFAESWKKRVTKVQGLADAYIRFWLRRSTVRILAITALSLFGIDVAFYYWKLAPYPLAEIRLEPRSGGIVHATRERGVREGKYSYYANRYNRTPSCREKPGVVREGFKILTAVVEAPTTGGTFSIKEIFELEFVQWIFKHFVGGEVAKRLDVDGPMTATCEDVTIPLPKGARLPGDRLLPNLTVELKESYLDKDTNHTFDYQKCPLTGFNDCANNFARVTDAKIAIIDNECVLRVVIMNWMQETMKAQDLFSAEGRSKFNADRVVQVGIDYYPDGGPSGKIVCRDEIPR